MTWSLQLLVVKLADDDNGGMLMQQPKGTLLATYQYQEISRLDPAAKDPIALAEAAAAPGQARRHSSRQNGTAFCLK